MKIPKNATYGLFALIGLVVACAEVDDNPLQEAQDQAALASSPPLGDAGDWGSFVERFIEDHLEAHPLDASAKGRHEYDGLFPDWSRDGIATEIERLTAWREAVLNFNEEALTPPQQFERRHLLSVVRGSLFWLDRVEWPFRNPAFYFSGREGLDPSGYVMREYAPPAERLSGLTKYLENLPDAVDQIKINLQGPLPLSYINYGVIRFGGLATFIQNDLDSAFSEVADSNLVSRFDVARVNASAALDELVAQLESLRESATDNFALGPELFLEMLVETEMIDLSLGELERIGTEDLERNLAELRKTCGSYAPGQSIRACMEKMSDNKPPEGPVETAGSLLNRLRSHVLDEDLLTIPLDDDVRVEEAPAFARTNLAYIKFTGPYEEKQEAIVFIGGPDPSWSEEVQRDFIPGQGYLVSLMAHEALPGHYAPVLRSRDSGSTFRQLFYSTTFSEGWAHYAEELLVESDFQEGDLEVRLGELSWALQRNVRFLCAIGLHTQGMTVEECETKFRDDAFQDEGTARQQAARGTGDPIYLCYTLGKLMIRQLRDDWTRDRGGRSAWKEFHDEFLSYGLPPIPLVRDAMLDGRMTD